MSGGTDGAPPTRWCRRCRKPATLTGVHRGTGSGYCADGQRIALTDEDPVLRDQADQVEARYRVKVSARLGHLRADTLDPLDPGNWQGDDYDDLVR